MGVATKFGQYVMEKRKSLNLTLKQVADKIKKENGDPLTPQYLNDIEHDRRNPPPEYIIKQIAKVLELDVDYLLGLKGDVAHDIKTMFSEKPNIGVAFRKAKKDGIDIAKILEDALEKKNK